MMYDGMGLHRASTPKHWNPWKKKYLWLPKIIDGKVYWLRYVHKRFRTNHWIPGSIEIAFEYQYAVDLFDLMQKDADVLS